MTDLATRALVSRSGMTRRVARLVEEGSSGEPTLVPTQRWRSRVPQTQWVAGLDCGYDD
jgi:hypothetical protein